MATENIRIEYEVVKKQLDEAVKTLKEFEKQNNLSQKEIDQTKEKFKDQEKQLSKTNQAFTSLGDRLKSLGNQVTVAGKGFGDMATGMFSASKATDATTKAMKFLKVAIASTGIGALVIALGSLVAYFKRTQTGADLLSKVMAGFGAAVDVVIDRLSALGGRLVDTFTHPKKALQDFGRAVKENIMNRFVGILEFIPKMGKAINLLFEGEFSEAAKTAGDAVAKVALGVEDFTDKTVTFFEETKESVKGFVTEIANESKAAAELDQRLSNLRKAESELTVEIAKRRAEIKAYNKDAEDTTLTEQERLDAANKAIETETALQQERVRLAQERVDILAAQNALGESMIEDVERENEARAALFNILMESDEMLTTLQNKRNILAQTIQKNIEAEQEAEKTRQEEEIASRIAELDKRVEIKKKASEAELDIELKRIEAEKQARKDGVDAIAGLVSEGMGDTKAAAVFNAAISTKEAAIAAFKAVVGIPVVGPALAPFAAAAATAFGLRNIAQIQAQQPPKFAEGGRIGGKRHSQGGTLIEAEKDEFVMNRNATAKYGFDFMEKINNLELKPLTLADKPGQVNIIDSRPLAEQLKKMPANVINIDSQGFALYQHRGAHKISRKIQRYTA